MKRLLLLLVLLPSLLWAQGLPIKDGNSGTLADVTSLASNNALMCAIVDGTGAQITSFGGGTQYVEDDAAAANPTGTMSMLVRDDTPNTQTTTDGDNIALRGTNYGAAYVQVVTSAGAFVDAFGGSGGTAQADRSSFTDGTTNMTPIGGTYNETNTNPTEDQAAAARITVERALHSNLRDHTADRGAAVLDTGTNDSLAVGIVDAAGNQITSFGGGTQYTEDVAAAADPVGTATNLIRQDTPALLTTTDGDNVALRGTNYGAAYTQIVTSTGSFVDSFGGGTQYAEDTALASGEQITMAGVIRDNTPASLVDADGDRTELQVDSTGRLWVNGSGVTQPISAASLPLPTGAATAANQDGVVRDGADNNTQANVTSGRLHVDGSGVTQPVSGTVSAISAFTSDTTAAWTNATSDETTLTLVTDGYATVIISLNATSTMTGGVVEFEGKDNAAIWHSRQCIRSGTTTLETSITLSVIDVIWQCNIAGFDDFRLRLSTVITGSGTANFRIQASNTVMAPYTTVQGTVTANAGSGTFIVGDGAGALNTIIDSGTVAATQSGTWTVQPGNTANTTPWLMSLNEGSVTADILDLTNNNPLTVAILDGSGSQITSFGGGVQYTEADTDASITGTALLWEDTSDTLRAASAAKPLPTRLSDGTDQVLVSGSGSLQVTCDNCGGASPFEDEDAFTVGTSSVSAVGYLVDETSPDSAPEDSAAAPRMSTNRVPYAQLRDAAGNERGANVTAANALKVDGSAVTQPVSGTVTATATDLDIRNLNATDDIVQARGAAADGAAVTGNPVLIAGQDGTNAQSIKTDSTGSVQVDIESAPTITVTATDLDIHNLTAANDKVDVGQFGGSNVVTGTGAGGSGIPRVTISNDSSLAANQSVNINQKGGVAVLPGPCEREVPLYAQVDQTAGEQIITGTASERVYICSIAIVTATAQNIALVDGTGSVCATSPTGLLGGSTAATGQNFAANGGWVLPQNPGAWAKTSTDADNVCLLQSGAGQVSGIVTYVSVPNI